MVYLRPLQILWDYLQMHQKPQKADCIIGFGNFNTNIARRAAQLYHQSYADKILFTGGLGRNTENLLSMPEAVRFTQVAIECGVPEKDILIEPDSSNTKENIEFSRHLLEASSIQCQHILGVHQPFMERRICAALGVYWPDVRVTITSPQVSIQQYLADAKEQGISENASISVIVGDFQRIDLYARKGYQLPQVIPPECWEAFHQLVALGYDQQLAR